MPIDLVVAWIVLDTALFACGMMTQYSELLEFLPGLLWGQFAAVTGWIVLGDDGIGTSLAVVVAGPIVVTVLVLVEDGLIDAVAMLFQGAIFTAIYAGLLNLPLVIARSSGWRFRFDCQPLDGALPIFQFSIRQIMVCTVLVALVAGLWSATRTWVAPHPSSRWGTHSRDLLAPLLIALPIPWSIWAAFWWTRPLFGAVVATFVTCLWSIVLIKIMALNIGLALVPATMVVHIVALQLAGFRLESSRLETPALIEGGPDSEYAERWKKYGETK